MSLLHLPGIPTGQKPPLQKQMHLPRHLSNENELLDTDPHSPHRLLHMPANPPANVHFPPQLHRSRSDSIPFHFHQSLPPEFQPTLVLGAHRKMSFHNDIHD